MICVLFLGSACFAEGTDLKAMSFEELSSLKVAVDAELNSRPEAKPFDLSPGLYTVGKDIKAGRYYIMASLPLDYGAHIVVYETKDAYVQPPLDKPYEYGEYKERYYLKYGKNIQIIDLEDGNYIYIQQASIKFSITEFTEEDYYEYTPPEGTYVPAGIYFVGEDIPAGIYQVYPATLAEGDVYIYENEAGKGGDWIAHAGIEFTLEGSYETVQLREGNKIEIDTDVVMKKQPKLNFD